MSAKPEQCLELGLKLGLITIAVPILSIGGLGIGVKGGEVLADALHVPDTGYTDIDNYNEQVQKDDFRLVGVALGGFTGIGLATAVSLELLKPFPTSSRPKKRKS